MAVHDRKFPQKAPIFPQEAYASIPRLGLSAGKVAGLSGPLQEEFAPEGLRLSALEIQRAGPATPEEMAVLVCKRIQAMSRAAIQTTIADALNSGDDVAKSLKSAFFPYTRRVLNKDQIGPNPTAEQLQTKIEAAFTAQGRF